MKTGNRGLETEDGKQKTGRCHIWLLQVCFVWVGGDVVWGDVVQGDVVQGEYCLGGFWFGGILAEGISADRKWGTQH